MNQPIRFRVPEKVHEAHRRARGRGVDVTREVAELVVRLADEHPLLTYARTKGMQCSAGEMPEMDARWVRVVTDGRGGPATSESRFVCMFLLLRNGAMTGTCTQIVVGDERMRLGGPRLPDGVAGGEAISGVESAEQARF